MIKKSQKQQSPILVTRPDLPPLNEFVSSLEVLWDSKILTNNGPYHQAFEKELAKFLGVKYLSIFSNGTLALMTALRALDISGEVITTPFSFVATTHALWLNNITPVFADIDPETLNLDPNKIENWITPATRAILPVHVYGTPCDVTKFDHLGKKHNVKIIYDAAHAFGVTIKGKSVLNFGDVSILSFHATKVFNTMEGGAVVCKDLQTKKRLDNLKNFGIIDETTVIEPGTNAKMTEMQAALGLLQLKYFNDNIVKRQQIANGYRIIFNNIRGIKLTKEIPEIYSNNGYFPIQINTKEFGVDRDTVYEHLKELNIFTRKYFSPLISEYPPYKDYPSASAANLPIATLTAREILCLPIYTDLDESVIERIAKYFKK